WSTCVKDGCGYGGTQTREVWCHDARRDARVSGNNCFGNRPVSIQTCYKSCKDPTYEVMWGMTPWSDCLLEPGVTVCSRTRGVQSRSVSCYYRGNDRKQDESLCSSFEQKPETTRRCDYQCPQNCIVGEFSEWSDCEECKSRNSTRTRKIVVAPENGGNQCPSFSEHRPCGNCSNTHFLKFTEWSKCASFIDKDNPLLPSHPLIGVQQRQFECINMLGNKEDLTECVGKFESVVKKQACIISQDCKEGEWGAWVILNESCVSENGNVEKGWMRRRRTVKQLPLGDGKPCEALEETSEVNSDTNKNCPRTQWTVSTWSKCKQVDGLQQCSKGLQQRAAICIEQNQDGVKKPVDDSRCSGKRPVTSQTCRAECDWDCTVTLWTSWSDCKVTDCDSYARKRRANKKTGQRYRTRTVLTPPGKNGQACPHLSETQNCDPEPCYIWNITTGPCNLLYGNRRERCGLGEARRAIGCVDKFGTAVSESLCAELREKPPTKVQCEVACENACVLSDWGEWSECPDICQQEENGRFRGPGYTQQRTRTILAKAPPGSHILCGTACPPRRELEERKSCPTVIECATYMWNAGPWGKCILPNKNMRCGVGVQDREVGCYNSNKQPVSDEKCTLKVKPTSAQSCKVPCPTDCKYTEDWSEWSECSATCIAAGGNSDNTYIPIRTRRRHILQYPADGGLLCPDIMTEQKDCLHLIACNKYQWVTSPWSECILPREPCGRGLRAREVTCQSGTNTTDVTKHSIDLCLSHVGQMPLMSEPCYVSCNDECVFTEWAEWSPCLNGCGTKRFRDRKLKVPKDPTQRLPSQCYDPILFPTYEQDVCHCVELKRIFMGEWSQCILEPPVEDDRRGLIRPFLNRYNRGRRNVTKVLSSGMGDTCGTGRKHRVVACTADNSIETADKCTIADYDYEECVEPCPVDCLMSEWSQWSRCPTDCGAGIMKRYRHKERLPSKGGRQCPNLDSSSREMQTRLCHPECRQHVWKTYDWTMCVPENSQCGNGTQSRSVSCVTINSNGYTTGIEMDISKCSLAQRPSTERPCQQPCNGDCVVTEWSDWTVCQQPCNYNQLQRRTRKIMRNSKPGFKPCPFDLEQTSPCRKGHNCKEYMWEWSAWTSCLVNNGKDDCGVGHKERFPICMSGTQEVDDRLCSKILGGVSEAAVRPCEIPCDLDCIHSPWSEWSTCSKTCGLGQTTRSRFIVERHRGNGRECSDNLLQTKQCFEGGCYRWNVSDWSPCMPQPNLCGQGVQVRNISCLGDDGLPASPTKCEANLSILVLKAEQQCKVPCPAECVMTEWSPWSQCYVPCEDFYNGISHGRKTRSRAITSHSRPPKPKCPDQLWERVGCHVDECTTFDWVATPWLNGLRTVHCQMTTGNYTEKVTGGCDPEMRPPEILNCNQNCRKLKATCVDTNKCECSSGSSEYGANNFLLRCVNENETLTLAAQEKEVTDESTNMWMYAVVAVATLFVIFVAIALYNMCFVLFICCFVSFSCLVNFLGKVLGLKMKSTPPTLKWEAYTKLTPLNEKKPLQLAVKNVTVCNTIPAPVDTMVTTKNGRLETTVTDDVGHYSNAWERKSFFRTLSGFLRASLPCMNIKCTLHEHDGVDETNPKDAYFEDDLFSNPATNAYAPFNSLEYDGDVQEDLKLLVHTPSYYLATRDGTGLKEIPYNIDRTSKVLTLPLDESAEGDLKNESIVTTESGGQSSCNARDVRMKRCYSDSAISVSITGSTSASSYTNSPRTFTNIESPAKRRFDYRLSKKISKDSNSSVKNSSITEDEELQMIVIDDGAKNITKVRPLTSEDKKGSMATFIENYFEKINSLPRDEETKPNFQKYLNISTVDDSQLDSSDDDLSSTESSEIKRAEVSQPVVQCKENFRERG
ncbi:hypothetical protein FSP39_023848, partial [Pinctada imbricata]